MGGWKAPALLNVPVLTDALVETAIPHLVGGVRVISYSIFACILIYYAD